MSTEAKMVKFKNQMKALDQHRQELQKKPEERDAHKLMPTWKRCRIRLRCRLCGRPRAVYRKFSICRICFRDMASDGLIPGVTKASW